jgi:hypothetical protein
VKVKGRKPNTGRISHKNRKIVSYVIQEYWDEICPICGNTNPPEIRCSKTEFKLQVELCCPECKLTISYGKPQLVKHFRSKNSPKSLAFPPSILNTVCGD